MSTITVPQVCGIPTPFNLEPRESADGTLLVRLYASAVTKINNLIGLESLYPNILDGLHEYNFYKTNSTVRFPSGTPYFDNVVGQILSTPWYFTHTKRHNLRTKILDMKDKIGSNEEIVECTLGFNNHSLSRLMSVFRGIDARNYGISVSDIINFVVGKYARNIEKLFTEKIGSITFREIEAVEPISPVFVSTPEFSDEEKLAHTTLIIHTDGASKNNGFDEDAAVAWTIRDEEKNILEASAKLIGKATNNQAEYQALSEALDAATKFCMPEKTTLKVFSDSKLMVEQLSGNYRINSNNLYSIFRCVSGKAKKYKKCNYYHLPRLHAKIRYCDRLCNMVLHDLFIRELCDFD